MQEALESAIIGVQLIAELRELLTCCSLADVAPANFARERAAKGPAQKRARAVGVHTTVATKDNDAGTRLEKMKSQLAQLTATIESLIQSKDQPLVARERIGRDNYRNCYACGKVGHMARECPERTGKAKGK